MKEKNQPPLIDLNKNTVRKILLIITFTLTLYFLLINYRQTLGIIKKTFSVISPFIIGFCIAFVVNVALRPLENLWTKFFRKKKWKKAEKYKRPVCLSLSLLIILGIILAVFFVIIPEFIKTLSAFIELLPYNLGKTGKWIETFFKNFKDTNLGSLGITPEKIMGILEKILPAYGENLINRTITFTASFFSGLIKFFIGLVLSVYMLSQKETLSEQVKKFLFVFVKKENAELCIRFSRIVNKTFTNFVTGQLTEAVIIGFLCFIGMSVLKLPYAPVISVLVGFTALIPVFGALFGTAIGAFLILLTSPVKALWFVIFIIVLQQIEGNLIYPRVVGKSVGLPAIWVLGAVTIGGSLFGFVGMLICVPVCSVLYSLLKIYVNLKTTPETKEKES